MGRTWEFAEHYNVKGKDKRVEGRGGRKIRLIIIEPKLRRRRDMPGMVRLV